MSSRFKTVGGGFRILSRMTIQSCSPHCCGKGIGDAILPSNNASVAGFQRGCKEKSTGRIRARTSPRGPRGPILAGDSQEKYFAKKEIENPRILPRRMKVTVESRSDKRVEERNMRRGCQSFARNFEATNGIGWLDAAS